MALSEVASASLLLSTGLMQATTTKELVLVTGSSGLIGARTADRLSAQFRVAGWTGLANRIRRPQWRISPEISPRMTAWSKPSLWLKSGSAWISPRSFIWPPISIS